MDVNEIEHRFKYHPPSEEQRVVYEKLRELITVYAHAINANIPDCREKSLALTKLEECGFHVNSAVARRT